MSFTAENCSALGDFEDDDVAMDFCNASEVKSLCLNACQLLACDEKEAGGDTPLDIFYSVCVKILTFLLLAGFAATVDVTMFFENFRSKGVYLGLFSQFAVMPFVGFISVLLFHSELDTLIAVMILLVTSCPGGAYSNWFCSMFNADLSLSVAMTTTATFLASFFLPLNVFCYLLLYQVINRSSSKDGDAGSIVSSLPFKDLFITLSIVIAGVIFGLGAGYFLGHHWQRRANLVGNVAGVLLQVLGLFASGTSCAPPWEQTIYVFVATALPLCLGMAIVFFLSSLKRMKVPKPQRVAIVIEAGYQNIGIATAVALSLGSEGRAAAVVPILYGTFQAIAFFIFCFSSVYVGWTLTPPGTPLLRMLFDDFQELIAVHPFYEEWRAKHPHAVENYTEEEIAKLKEILRGNGKGEKEEEGNKIQHYSLPEKSGGEDDEDELTEHSLTAPQSRPISEERPVSQA